MTYLTVKSLQKRPEFEQKLCSILTIALLGFGGMHVEWIAAGRLRTGAMSGDIRIIDERNIGGWVIRGQDTKGPAGVGTS